MPSIGRWLALFALKTIVALVGVFAVLLVPATPASADELGVANISPSTVELRLDATQIVAAKQTITVKYTSTSAESGYHVTISANPGGTANLVSDNGRFIEAIPNASQELPLPLPAGTWGYAIPGRGNFNQNYIENTDISSLWATMPSAGATDIIAETGGGEADGEHSYDVWFGVRASDEMMIAGDYTTNIVYTVTANPVEPAVIESVLPNSYNLGDTTVPARVTITGSNLISVGADESDRVNVCIIPESASDASGCDNGDTSAMWALSIVGTPTYTTLVVDLPNDPSIASGNYSIWVKNGSGIWGKAPEVFEYTRTVAITGISPNSYDLDGDKPIEMAGSDTHQVILMESGQVFTSGQNNFGQLGIGTIDSSEARSTILHNITAQFDGKVISVSAVGNFTLALTDDGKVYSWGYNGQGELGDGTTNDSGKVIEITNNFNLPAGRKITKIYAGWEQAFAIADDGALYSWGNAGDGRLGRDTTATPNTLPGVVNDVFDGNIIDLATDSHTVVLTDTNKVYTWGFNDYGQLGIGNTNTVSGPQDITGSFNGDTIVQVEASSNGSFARTIDGRLYAWGQNDYGNLGFGEEINNNVYVADELKRLNVVYRSEVEKYKTPTEVAAPFSEEGVEQLAVGFRKTMATTTGGAVYVWGDNNGGSLGIVGDSGDEHNLCDKGFLGAATVNCSQPYYAKRSAIVLGDLYNGKFESIFASGGSLFAIGTDGSVYSWGRGGTPDQNNVTSETLRQEGVLMGANLTDVDRVFIDSNGDGQYNEGEDCNIVSKSINRIYFDMPSAPDEVMNIQPGESRQYQVLAQRSSGEIIGEDAGVWFTYYRD